MTQNSALDKYIASEQTIRSLDHLGSLLMSDDRDEMNKGLSLVQQTSGEPLLRLYRGAVSRFTRPFLIPSDPKDPNEVFAGMNKLVINSYLAGDVEMPDIIIDRYTGEGNVMQNLLITIIIQYEKERIGGLI